METNMSRAVRGAKLIGFNNDGLACVWSGGYGFNVYDAARDWQEVDHFTSGELAGISEKFEDERRDHARFRMEDMGYTVVE